MSETHITVWYVTPVRDASHKIDGPFESYSQAQKRCVQLASEETRQRIINEVLAGKTISQVGLLYISKPFVLTHVPGAIKYRVPAQEPVVIMPVTPLTLQGKLKLLSRGKLMKIAKAINLVIPDDLYHNRAALATYIYIKLKAATTE